MKSVRFMQNWNLREPEQGIFEWGPLKTRLQFYKEREIDVLLTLNLRDFPEWFEKLDREAQLKSFENYITHIIKECGRDIKVIQFGNEWGWEIDSFMDGDEALFIEMNNILYRVVKGYSGEKPIVSLGSLSIGALRLLSYNKGRLENVFFDNQPLYSEEELKGAGEAARKKGVLITKVFKECDFDLIDLHFYDEYWNWEIYLETVKDYLKDAGKDPAQIQVVATEFGGPEPNLEPPDGAFQGKRMTQYLETLQQIGVTYAVFFKMIQGKEGDPMVVHPNSYLINQAGESNEAYQALKQFQSGLKE